MQSEEEKRRLELYKQQIPRFVVQTGPSKTPKQVPVQPNIPIKVSQPQAPVTPITQPSQPAQDRRPFWSKVVDQVNPFDAGRTFKSTGPTTDLTWAQRNINALTGPKIIKDVAQGLAQTPIVMMQSAGEITKKLASNKDAQKALAMPYEQRKAIIQSSTGNWITDKNNPLNFYNPNYGVAKFFQETKIDPTDENIKKYIQGQEEYKKTPITFQPTSRLQKAIFGEQPVTSYQQAGKDIAKYGAEKSGQKWINKLAPGLAIGMFALDLPSRGFEGAFTRTVIKQLVKEEAPDVIAKLLEQKGIKLAEEEIQALAKATSEQEVKSIVKTAEQRVADEAAQVLAKSAEQTIPTTTIAEKATEVATKAVSTPTAAVTAEQVKNLLQGLPETSRTQFADELAKATSPEAIQNVITRIENSRQAVTQAVETQVPEALPVTPVQRQAEALAQAVEQPTAPTQVAPSPITAVPEAPTPTAIQGAVGTEGIQTLPPSRFAIKETPEQTIARLRARQAEAPIDQARIGARDVAERQALSERQAFVALPTTDFVERLAEQTGVSPKWLRRAVDKGYGKDWVYIAALDSVKGAEDVNKVFNNRVKNIKIGVLPKGKNLSPLIGKEIKLTDGTIVKVLDTVNGDRQLQVEMPDGTVRTGITKNDIMTKAKEDLKLYLENNPFGVTEQDIEEIRIGRENFIKQYNKEKMYDEIGLDRINQDRVEGLTPVLDKGEFVTVYRGGDGGPLKPGDYVTTNPKYAEEFGDVRKETVPAASLSYTRNKDVLNKNIEEMIYNPVNIKQKSEVIKQSIPKVTDVNAPLSDTVIVNNNIINKATGEILEPPKPIFERVKALPDYNKATVEDFDTILRARDDLKNYWDNLIKVNGQEVADKVQEEVFLLDKGLLSPNDASPRTMELLNGYIKPVLDALGAKSKRSGEMGVREFYLPQLRKTYGEPVQVEFGYSTIDKANTEFGSAYRREGINELQDLAPLGEQLNNYVDQWVYDNYNNIAVASKPEYANTYTDPVNYLRDEENIIQKLAVKADEQIANINKTVEPSDTMIIDDVTQNFQKHALPEIKKIETIDINGRLPRGTSLLEDREILQGLGIYDKFGFKAYDEANITGAQIFQDNFADIAKMNREQIQERLTELYAKQFTEMPESTDYVIRKRANAIFNDLNNSRKNVQMGIEPEVSVPAYHFAKLEKDLAAAKIYYNLQRANIKDEGVKKLLNRQLEKTLTDNRRIETFGEKILNSISETLHTAMLGLKIPSAVQNLTETLRLTGILDDDILKEVYTEAITGKLNVKETLQRIGQDRSVLKQLSNIPTNQKRITATNLLDKSRNVAMAGFDATEGIKDTIFLRGFELQGRKRGLSGRELGQYIAENYNKYAFKGGQFGSLGFNQNPVGRLLFQFSQYPIKQIKLNARYAKQALSTDPAVRNQALKYLGRTFGSNAAAAAVLYPIFGWGMQRALGVDLPKFGPTVSLTVELYNVINDELERVNNENNRLAESGSNERVGYNWNNVLDRWGRKVAAYPIPGGDWLFNKLGVGEFLPDGYNPFSKNTAIATWQRGYEENYKGQARIEGPQNWYDYATQAIGGQYNTAAARGYFGTNPFSFTIDVPGTAADIRIFSDERLKPLNKAEQQYFDKLKTPQEKTDFLTQKHKKTRLYQELKKEFGDNLDKAIYGPTYTNTATGERTVLDSKEKSIEKARLLLNVPGLLEAVNMLNAENPLPIKDPFLVLIPEHQKTFLRYQASEDNQKKAIYELNKDWMQPFMNSRDSYYAQFEIAGEKKNQQKDKFGLMPPELTDNIKSLRDKFFTLEGWEARKEFLLDNPSLQTYLKDKDKYERNYNTLTYRPNIDPYPEPDAETQQYLDEYTASGPAKTEGRKAVERSAWIKANPKKWEKVQAFFTASAMWSLQNELALTTYEGIEPSEKALKDIMSLAKGMGLSQFGYGNQAPSASDIAYNNIVSNLQAVSAKGIGLEQLPKAKKIARFKVRVPSSRRTQQIRLR